MSDKMNFDLSCRLCAELSEASMTIFGTEGIRTKILKYLSIEIQEDDPLPKNICFGCVSKLNNICKYIDHARNIQNELLEQYSKLHISVKSEAVDLFEETDKVTELEVTIDPMSILGNPDSESSLCKNNIAQLHGFNIDDDITIKLIKNQNEKDGDNLNRKRFPCTVCQRRFQTELALRNHSWTHYNTEPLSKIACSICRFDFPTKKHLFAHLKTHKHNNTTCFICARVFRSQLNLAHHLETHKSNKSYTCKDCGRTYNTLSNLRTHSVSHSNDRPFKCHLCMKCFKRNQDLKFHINQHTGAKPYKCPYCERCFASSGNCYSHRNRMHPGRKNPVKYPYVSYNKGLSVGYTILDRPYKCSYCNNSFKKKENLTYHMYQHTGIKSFKCNECSRCFVSNRALFMHYQKNHPTNNDETTNGGSSSDIN